MPPNVRDWLPDDHLALFVIDAVSELDLGAFYAAYRHDGWGRPAYDPAMMVALVLYAYAQGVRSSRAIERRCAEDVAFRVIAANECPDHATIARFRADHEQALGGLFTQVLALCARAGLVRAGVVALDSTKVAANASGHANRTYRQIAEEILGEAAAVDAAEDELYGDRRGDELPPELVDPATRRQRLRELKAELEAEHEAEREAAQAKEAAYREHVERTGRRPRGRAPSLPPPGQEVLAARRVNVTDPDSRPMRTHRGFIQGYNAQAVCTEEQIVLAADVTGVSSDGGMLEPMIAAAGDQLAQAGVKERPEVVLADAGYWKTDQIQRLARAGVTALVPPERQARPPAPARRNRAAEQMRQQLADEEGKRLYRRRQHMIEPVFAQTKVTRRADRFLRRGIQACRAEWQLITATHNLLKLWRATTALA